MFRRVGIGVFVTTLLVVVALSAGLLFFPRRAAEKTGPPALQAQIIRPATTSRRRNSPASPVEESSLSASRKQNSAGIRTLDEIWQLILLDGQRIGYSRTVFEQLKEGKDLRIRTTTEMHLAIKRFGQITRMKAVTRTLETAQGDLLFIEMESGSGAQKSKLTGRVTGHYLRVETTTAGRTTEQFYEWRPGIKSPTYPDRLVRTVPLKPGEVRRFKTFLPDAGRMAEVQLAAETYHRKKLRDGKMHRLLRVQVTQSVSPTEVVSTYLDERGRPVLSESEFLGKTMSHYIVSAGEALQELQGGELDLGLRTLIRTAAAPKLHLRELAIYRIHMPGDDPARHLVASERQQVQRIDAHTIELTVKRRTWPRRSEHVHTAAEYLSASRFLDANDPRVREHARRAAGYQTDPVQIARKMERYVHETLSDKNFSTAMGTASQTARSLSGDCTEHAVLLAALLRVRRIPSRVAIGLVYDERLTAFVAHMWTEARLGKEWVPLDATRKEGGVGAGHIKLADASFADKAASPLTAFLPLMNVLGRWRIEIRRLGPLPGEGNRRGNNPAGLRLPR